MTADCSYVLGGACTGGLNEQMVALGDVHGPP